MILTHNRAALSICVTLVICVACGKKSESPQESINVSVAKALKIIHLETGALSVPKLGRPYSTPGRLPLVDQMMKNPLRMIDLSQALVSSNKIMPKSDYLIDLVGLLGFPGISKGGWASPGNVEDVWQTMLRASGGENSDLFKDIPEEWRRNEPLYETVLSLLSGLTEAFKAYPDAGGSPTSSELGKIKDHLANAISSDGSVPEDRRLSVDAYHQIGERVDVRKLTEILIVLLESIEHALPVLHDVIPPDFTRDWQTPLGVVRIAGSANDRHSGDFLLLIDLGGDDIYEDIGRSGSISMVVDVAGDDVVKWKKTVGPGAGIMGIGLWVDMQGNDQYKGRNMGLGAGILGAGLFWDASGDDIYIGGSLVQGAGQYGIGIFIDEDGDDTYQAEMNGQGYGGTGGVGIQLDFNGNDAYFCGGIVPDQVAARNKRHGAVHYLSLCQGYALGRRPEVSGGIGLLLDEHGNDTYETDLFGQGAALWFGLGILVDKDGNDQYKCFEHCQGEGLHLGAGLLSDWGGDDQYQGFEHAQGVGVDRAVGLLYDHVGNDQYRSNNESQGAGIKPYGAGILIDKAGDDRYEAVRLSQGYSARPPEGFPESQWPVGMLLDLEGEDTFNQVGVSEIIPGYRVQNRQGMLVDQ